MSSICTYYFCVDYTFMQQPPKPICITSRPNIIHQNYQHRPSIIIVAFSTVQSVCWCLRTLQSTFHSLFYFASHFHSGDDDQHCIIVLMKKSAHFKDHIPKYVYNQKLNAKKFNLIIFAFVSASGIECLVHAISDRSSFENSKLSNLTLSPFSVKWSFKLILLL